MKMTFDLPADVAQRLKIRAAEEGLKLKDLVAEACRAFLSSGPQRKNSKQKRAPYPILKGGRPAKPEEEMTPERVAEILWGSGE
jgi:plasmid stability protein